MAIQGLLTTRQSHITARLIPTLAGAINDQQRRPGLNLKSLPILAIDFTRTKTPGIAISLQPSFYFNIFHFLHNFKASTHLYMFERPAPWS